MAEPVLLPEPYSDESGSWTDRIDHFECIVEVNKWATEEEKLKWLHIHLTGKAQTAFRKLPERAYSSYTECTAALKKRFDLDSERKLHVAELNMRPRGKTEDWASLRDALSFQLIQEQLFLLFGKTCGLGLQKMVVFSWCHGRDRHGLECMDHHYKPMDRDSTNSRCKIRPWKPV